MNQKTRNITGWILTGLVALVMIGSAVMKLMGSEEAVKGAAMFGISESTLKIIGTLEILSIVLFIIPKTGVLGTLLNASYMGGAISTHVQHSLPVIMPCIIQALVWIAALLRFPELGTRLFVARSAE